MSDGKPALNVDLLRRVQQLIQEEPRRLSMDTFGCDGLSGPDVPACGTVACIGGWIGILSGLKFKNSKLVVPRGISVERFAANCAGLTLEETDALFFEFDEESGPAGIAEAISKIDLLIADREKFVDEWLYSRTGEE